MLPSYKTEALQCDYVKPLDPSTSLVFISTLQHPLDGNLNH